MWHAQAVEVVIAAEKGAVKEEDVAAAAAANHDGTSAKAEAEPAASSAPSPAAALEKAAVKPDEAPARVRGPLGCCLQNDSGISVSRHASVLVPSSNAILCAALCACVCLALLTCFMKEA